MEEWLRSEWEEFRLGMENVDRKRQMEEELGASFGSGDQDIDPALESEWLNYIEEFEHQFEHAQRIPVRQYLGYPSVKASADVPDEALETELNALYDLLAENNVALGCICEVPDRELYRFIAEELLDEEIDDMRIPGMTCSYIYEEFHPNDIYDVSEALRSLVYDLLRSDPKFQEHIFYNFCREKSFSADGQPQSWEELNERINAWFAVRPEVTEAETEIGVCAVDDDDARVEADVRWHCHARPRHLLAHPQSPRRLGCSSGKRARSSIVGKPVVPGLRPPATFHSRLSTCHFPPSSQSLHNPLIRS